MIIYLWHKLLRLYLGTFSPRWMFKQLYRPATEGERKESQTVRNRIRLIEYKSKR